jgi:hypothetical protein
MLKRCWEEGLTPGNKAGEACAKLKAKWHAIKPMLQEKNR